MTFLVNDFFVSLQGEGPAIGEPAAFIRLSGCNLACAYCDTAHEVGRPMEVDAILDAIRSWPARVVLTGGEPLLAGEKLVELAAAVSTAGRMVDIETNGTIAPPSELAGLIDNYVISPKLSNSGVSVTERRLAEGLPPGPLKFAVGVAEELDEVAAVAAEHPERQVIIMPLGTGRDEMLAGLERLRAPVRARGWRLLPRLQVLLGLK